MWKIFAALVFGLVVLPLSARAQMAPQDPLAQAENAFSVDLYGKLSRTPGNLFFSPYSVATALDMVFVGARGATADELAQTLHLNLLGGTDSSTLLQTALLSDAKSQKLFQYSFPDGFKFQSANALWGAKGYSFNQDFISSIKTSFGGDLRPVNFKHPERAAAKINNWVSGQTNGKIQNLVPPDALNTDTRMVLTNAVYFKAAWAEAFDASQTKQAKFHVAAGRDVEAEMMNMTDNFQLTQTDGVKVLSIVYRYGDASMIIILPDNNQGLAKVEAGLTAKKLNSWLAAEQSVPVILSIPKFTTDSAFDLNGALTALGMTKSFDPQKADFTGIADDPKRPLYVGDVIHKAYIGIDEKGTEAAAATAVAIAVSASAAPMWAPPPPVPFIADHPFIYLIQANPSGEILFMGRVDDPTRQGS